MLFQVGMEIHPTVLSWLTSSSFGELPRKKQPPGYNLPLFDFTAAIAFELGRAAPGNIGPLLQCRLVLPASCVLEQTQIIMKRLSGDGLRSSKVTNSRIQEREGIRPNYGLASKLIHLCPRD